MAVYEEYRRGPKKDADTLADTVPWRMVAGPGVILQKDQGHTLQRSWAVRGPDMMGVDWHVQASLMLQANDVLKHLGGRWVFQSEAQRLRVTSLPPLAAPLPLLGVLDRAYRAQLLAEPGIRETRYYHTLSWTPPAPLTSRLSQFFVRGPGNPARPQEAQDGPLLRFLEQSAHFMDLLQGVLARSRPLTTLETLAYLHSCVSDQWERQFTSLPGSLTDIDCYLCDTPLSPAGWFPQLGRWHIRTCSLKAYPRQSVVGMLKTLEALPIDFRWCTRWLGLEKHVQQGILRKARKAWLHEEKTLADRLSENMTHESSRTPNRTATNNADDVDIAEQEIGADLIAYGGFASTVTVWDADPQAADEKRQLVMRAFQARSIGTTEEKVHQTAAWFSSHPGNRRDNVHQSTQSTFTLAHLTPGLTAAWPGPERDAYMGGGPWFYARTEGNTLFRVVDHVYNDETEDFRDLGHFAVLGFTGAGKSTLGNWLRLMWLQYAQTQAILFDLDRHGRLLTLLLGGRWVDLGAPHMQFQPLRHVDDPLRRGVALQGLRDLMDEYHQPMTAHTETYLDNGLLALAKYPLDARTFTTYLGVLQEMSRRTEEMALKGERDASGAVHVKSRLQRLTDEFEDVRKVLRRFANDQGEPGLFDGVGEDFDDNRVQTFELRDLLDQARLHGPVLRYVLPEVERRMSTDRKMWLMFDDAAIPLEVPAIRTDLKAWLRAARKKGCSVGIATHDITDLFATDVGTLLVQSVPVRFYLYNPEATKPTIRALYQKLGLTDPAIDQIAVMRPQREVYYELREMGQRPFSLEFPRIILDCIARNTASDHRLIDEILQKEGPEGFAAGWFRHHGYDEEATFLTTGVHHG